MTDKTVENIFNIRLWKAQERVIRAVKSGELALIGYDIGKTGGDKSCTIYGHEVNGQVFVDEVIYDR